MPVPNTMADLSTLAGSNSPAGSEVIGNSLDNYIRAGFAIVRSTYALAASTIASAPTVDVASASGESVQITGTTGITSLGAGYAGCMRELRFSGALTLTNSASLKLGGANITTIAGDVMSFRCTAAGVWELASLSRPSAIDSALFVLKAGDTMTGALTATTFTASGNNYVGGATAIALGPQGAGSILLRPNGVGSVVGQTTISTAGDLQSSGQVIGTNVTASTNNFIGGATAVTLGPSGAGQILLRPNAAGSATGQVVVASSGAVTMNGNLTLAGGSATGTAFNWISTSDKDLKMGVVERVARAALPDQIRFVNWKWKANGEAGCGVIAQEVRDIAPEYVHESDDGTLGVDKASLALECVIALSDRLRKLEA